MNNGERDNKRDYSRYKKSKYRIKLKDNGIDDDLQDEILHIQGLVRCKSCHGAYPLDLKECPHCKKNKPSNP